MKKAYILASLLLVGSIVITSCKGGGKGDKEAKTNEVIAEGVVNIIDEEYFRENIWDYSVQPGAFEYKGTVPVVIDFYADWCAPCKKAAPVLERLAKTYKGKVMFYKIDTDQNRGLASVLQINTIPSFMYIPVKGEPEFSMGILPTPELTERMFTDNIEKYLFGNTSIEAVSPVTK